MEIKYDITEKGEIYLLRNELSKTKEKLRVATIALERISECIAKNSRIEARETLKKIEGMGGDDEIAK